MKRRHFLAATAGTVLGGIAASPLALAEGGVITIATDPTEPPFETEKDGQIVGFDIDLIHAIAQAEGLQITLKAMPFNGIIPMLQAHSVDAAISGVTITRERMQNIDFSNAYYHAGLSIVVKDGSAIQGVDDLHGHLVAAKKGTSGVDYLLQHGFTSSDVKQFQNINAAYQTLLTGGADAVIYDNPMNVDFVAQHQGTRIAGGLLTGEYYGIAFSKGQPELVAKINAGLAKVQESGAYAAIFKRYFGNDTTGMVDQALAPAQVAAGA